MTPCQDLGVFPVGLRSGSSNETPCSIVRVCASPPDTSCPDFRVVSGARWSGSSGEGRRAAGPRVALGYARPGLLGFCLGVAGVDREVRHTTSYLGSARRLGIHLAKTLGWYSGVWEANHPVKYTATYLGSARRPGIHHARTLGIFFRGLGSGSSTEMHHAILKVRASP